MPDKNSPIGVFDSGLGGLTVVRSLITSLPNENIVYFGDTGRVPYGTRSEDVIRQYARQDAEFLQQKGVKLIVAACGTVSSVAYDVCNAMNIPFVGVVSPAVKAASLATKNKRIGVLGTTATIKSNSHKSQLKEIDDSFEVFQQACPLFVSIVESGFFNKDDEIAKAAVKRYLAPMKEKCVDTIILGCTHFPLLSEAISDYVGNDVTLISNGEATAQYVTGFLNENDLLRDELGGICDFYVSDTPQNFSELAQVFLGKKIKNITQVTFD